jgi:hypothetical protein
MALCCAQPRLGLATAAFFTQPRLGLLPTVALCCAQPRLATAALLPKLDLLPTTALCASSSLGLGACVDLFSRDLSGESIRLGPFVRFFGRLHRFLYGELGINYAFNHLFFLQQTPFFLKALLSINNKP